MSLSQIHKMSNKYIVLDTNTNWLYIGIISNENDRFFILDDADAYDISETTLTKHEYLMKIKKDGVVANRKTVKVLKSSVIAITNLDDILTE